MKRIVWTLIAVAFVTSYALRVPSSGAADLEPGAESDTVALKVEGLWTSLTSRELVGSL